MGAPRGGAGDPMGSPGLTRGGRRVPAQQQDQRRPATMDARWRCTKGARAEIALPGGQRLLAPDSTQIRTADRVPRSLEQVIPPTSGSSREEAPRAGLAHFPQRGLRAPPGLLAGTARRRIRDVGWLATTDRPGGYCGGRLRDPDVCRRGLGTPHARCVLVARTRAVSGAFAPLCWPATRDDRPPRALHGRAGAVTESGVPSCFSRGGPRPARARAEEAHVAFSASRPERIAPAGNPRPYRIAPKALLLGLRGLDLNTRIRPPAVRPSP